MRLLRTTHTHTVATAPEMRPKNAVDTLSASMPKNFQKNLAAGKIGSHHLDLAPVTLCHCLPLFRDRMAKTLWWWRSAIVIAINSPNFIILACSWCFAHLRWITKLGLVNICVQIPGIWIVHLQSIEWLPGSDNLACVRISPNVVWQQIEVIKHLLLGILANTMILNPFYANFL